MAGVFIAVVMSELDAADITALTAAHEKLKADPNVVRNVPELAFFKELLVSWGAGEDAAPRRIAGSPAKNGATAVDDLEDHPPLSRKPTQDESAVPMDLSDEEPAPAPQEMDLPLGELDDEFEDEPENLSGEKDPEILSKDTAKSFPPLPPQFSSEPSGARKKVFAKIKKQAADALETGNSTKALQKYTEALQAGDATATVLSTRAKLLLQQKRPCAAIRDCCAALMLNPDYGKAYQVRGMAHRKLGHYKKAHRDLEKGQKLDYSEECARIHDFVAKRVGMSKDSKAAAKAPEPKAKAKASGQSSIRTDIAAGQAVRVDGLEKAAHLNQMRGVIMRLDPAGNGRWEVELRLAGGRVEIKSLNGKNIFPVKAADAGPWKREEAKHMEERKKRDIEDKRWKDEEERKKKAEDQKRKENKLTVGEDFPDMDPAEYLEAEMSAMPLDGRAMALLRRLKPQQALGILQQDNIASVGSSNLSTFVSLKVKQMLGEPDSDEEPVMAAKARASESQEDPDTEYDPEKIEAESEPFPPQCEPKDEPNSREASTIAKAKREAAEALEDGVYKVALKKYTEVVMAGGGTALILSKRAEVLLKERRPCAAIQDCSKALKLNTEMGKAFRVRGLAQRRLGKWIEASKDLATAQRLDFDENTVAVARLASIKAKAKEEFLARKRRRTS